MMTDTLETLKTSLERFGFYPTVDPYNPSNLLVGGVKGYLVEVERTSDGFRVLTYSCSSQVYNYDDLVNEADVIGFLRGLVADV